MSGNIVFSSCKRIIKLLPATERRKLPRLLGLILVSSSIDIFGLALLIPLLSIILDESLMTENTWLAYLYEHIGFSSRQSFILNFCGIITLIMLLKSILSLWIAHYQAKYAYSFFEYFTNNLLKHYFYKDFSFFKNINSSIVVRDIRLVPEKLISGVLMPVMNLINEMTILLVIIVSILSYNVSAVLLLLLVTGPVSFIFYRFSKNKIQQIGSKINEFVADLEKTLYQTIFGYVDVKVTNTEKLFFHTYKNYIQSYNKHLIKINVYNVIPLRIIEMSMVLAIITIVIYGTLFFADKDALTILLSVLAISAYRLLPSVNRIMLAILLIKQNQYTIDITENILSTQSSQSEQSDEAIRFKERIKLDNIAFSYRNKRRFALQNINFEIKKGETIGIVGHSGSGKSTLINILLRFLKEEKGRILIDDNPLSDKQTEPWRKLLGYVQQDVFLIDGTIKENIAFGIVPEAIDEKKLNEVIWQASLGEFVADLANGVDTLIGERGTLLSGGQKQRVGIARALYAGAQILFLDEATSALDTKTEKEITEAIRKLSDTHFTMCIIAHRITTLKYCDKIIKITDGQVESICTYQELLKEELAI